MIQQQPNQVFDVLGIGFGPSNVAIATAFEEMLGENAISYCFVEKQKQFKWHGGMLLDGTRMQISCFKDLAMMRNPSSKFTFVNYLNEQGRLSDFVNLKTFYPTRIEFNDYLNWVADHFDHCVDYDQEVVAVTAVEDDDNVKLLVVTSKDSQGNETKRYARNLIVSVGGRPCLPEHFQGLNSERISHSSGYKYWQRDALFDTETNQAPAPRIAVVGAGQSAAEIFIDLTNQYPDGQVELLGRGCAIRPSDSSPFVNTIFNPEYVDEIYSQTPDVRKALISDFSYTNYSVVDMDEIEQIYERLYMQKVTGQGRHQYRSCQSIEGVRLVEKGVELTLRDMAVEQVSTERYDGVVLATGYRYDAHRMLLNNLAPWFVEGAEVERYYRLPMKENFLPNIMMLGANEATHGLSDTLLSLSAVRAKEVVERLFPAVSEDFSAQELAG